MPIRTRTHALDPRNTRGFCGKPELSPLFEDKVENGVYFDNAATTMLEDEVVEAMMPYFRESFGNASSPHHLGADARKAVDEARELVAELLGSSPSEVYFTSGGTEANNWAVQKAGTRESVRDFVLTSNAEHLSVLRACGSRRMDPLPVDTHGRLSPEAVAACLESCGGAVDLVSVRHCCGETGTINDVAAIAEVCRKYDGVLFHVDACQSFGKWQWTVDDLGADLVTVSAHKMHGPMGIGALYVRAGTKIGPLLMGGSSTGNLPMRAGTLAVPNVVGFGVAAELARTTVREAEPKMRQIIEGFQKDVEIRLGARVNGDRNWMAPHIASLTFPDADADVVAAVLDRQFGMCVSGGGDSHVLEAMGLSLEERRRTMRISLSRLNTAKQVRGLVSGMERAVREAKERSLD